MDAMDVMSCMCSFLAMNRSPNPSSFSSCILPRTKQQGHFITTSHNDQTNVDNQQLRKGAKSRINQVCELANGFLDTNQISNLRSSVHPMANNVTCCVKVLGADAPHVKILGADGPRAKVLKKWDFTQDSHTGDLFSCLCSCFLFPNGSLKSCIRKDGFAAFLFL
jgi:hypothetical protein